jgi:hypothetical protein
VAPEASPFVFAAIVGTAAAAGDQAGAAIDRHQARSSSQFNSQPIVPQIVPSPQISPTLGIGPSPGSSPATPFPLLSEAEIAASDLPLEESWGPDDAIYALMGIGVAARAAAVAARELGPVAMAGLRSLASETGAVRIAAGKGIEELAEAHITRSGRTVLGHFPEYIQKARTRGASYFDIGDAWNRLSETQRWNANKHFLDMIVSFRDRVLLSLPKGRIRPGSALEREVEYLTKKKGYRWLNQWSLGPK